MRKDVIMGIQGSGKGTHATMLAGDFGLAHIAVGDIIAVEPPAPHQARRAGQARAGHDASPVG